MKNPEDKQQIDEYDSPWKEILELYLREFLAFFLPIAHDNIDWSRNPEFLDTEMARILPEAQASNRQLDKLVKVWRRDGVEEWLLIHIEIQGEQEAKFAERMFTCMYRARDLHQQPVVGLAILADMRPKWRPFEYHSEVWGTLVTYRFNTFKLLDYIGREAELEASDNPFAIVTMAHLRAKQTKHKYQERYQSKMQIIRRLYQSGYTHQQIVHLFLFIDWVMWLPKELDQQLWIHIGQFEENKKMRYMSSIERIGIEKGIEQGKKGKPAFCFVNFIGVFPNYPIGSPRR
ncbi:MAG: hypothetical protein H7832_06480 [Magnetococcus sp. DMHC-6]